MSDIRIVAESIELRKIEDLAEYANNARKHSDAQIDELASAIKEFGWTIPVLIDEDGAVIAGHGRLLAAERLGMTTVPVMVADGWTEDQKRAYVIVDNRMAEKSEWDFDVLNSEIGELSKTGFDTSMLGFDVADFSFAPKFEPNLQPATYAGDVTDGDIEKASHTAQDVRGSKTEGTSVTCPHCGEEFSFVGN